MADVEAVATFGFVDLAGFTALTEAHGDHEAVALLDRFEALTVTALEGQGRLVKTIGDAVMVVWPDPESAVRSLGRLFEATSTEPSFLASRAGLHQGAAVERDGDYFGGTVNLAARVAGHAHAGQLLATSEVAATARDIGIDVVDLGPFELRNVRDPVELYEIEVCPALAGSVIDPVCRMQVGRSDAVGRLRHHDADYWFCSLRCASAFATDPGRYTTT